MPKIFRKSDSEQENLIPVPPVLPPVEGLEQDRENDQNQPRVWLWTLLAALAVLLLIGYVVALGVLGFYDGLRDRALVGQQQAQEHYATAVENLEAGEYELAVAGFEQALRLNSDLQEARIQLEAAKELAQAAATPTSETRLDAVTLLYRQGVAHYENGNLASAVAVLEELKGLDTEFQQENVNVMLSTSHYQLGLRAVDDGRLDGAEEHFQAVLVLEPGHADAQEQLDLIHLYTAAMNYWDRDWAATIQSLKGLYALAPDYKDVQGRLVEAYQNQAQAYADEGDWCQAAGSFAAAAEISPSSVLVSSCNDATARCQATAEAPTPAPTTMVTAGPTPMTSVATPTPAGSSAAGTGQGRIAFTSYDVVRQRYDVYVVDLRQGNATLLLENASQPSFAPTGNALAFRNLDPSHLGLGVLDLKANSVQEVTAHSEDSTPSWSSNLEQLVFSSNKHGDRRWRVYAISPKAVRGEGEEWAYGQMASWSPDGTRIAYHGCDERGDNCGIWVIKAGGFGPSRASSHASDTSPSWSPDGKQLAFISSRAGNWEIYSVDLTTGQEVRLSDHPAADVAPIWSPNGRQIAFLSNREGAWALYVLDVRSRSVSKVIATGDAYPDPVSERLSWVTP